MANNRILVISDLHAPYQHPDAIAFLAAIKEKYNPDRVISIGDEADKHALSFHPSDPDLPSAGDELKKAREVIWKIEELYPKVDVIESNHGSLAYRKAMHHGIPRDYLRSYEEVMFPDRKTKWKWHYDLTLTMPNGQRVYLHHGKNANYLLAAQKMGMCFVQGHYHEKFGAQWWGTPDQLIWAMNVGCLIDDSALAFAYNKTTLQRPVIGCGMIIDSQPRPIPLVMNRGGRWNRKLT